MWIFFIVVKLKGIRIVYNYCIKEFNIKIVLVLMSLVVLYINYLNMISWKYKGSVYNMIFLVFFLKVS